jgi:hypothetical protein
MLRKANELIAARPMAGRMESCRDVLTDMNNIPPIVLAEGPYRYGATLLEVARLL